MSNILQRTVTGVLFGIMVFGSLFAGSISFLVFYSVLLVLSLLEFYKLTVTRGVHVQKFPAIAASVAVFILLFGYSSGLLPPAWMTIMILFPAAIMILELYRKKSRPFDNLVWTFAGIIYVTLPVSMLNLLVFRGEPGTYNYYPGIVAGVFMLIMINDSVAYLVGVPLGRHRLFERISPKKSWEGAVAGAIVVIGISVFMTRLFPVLNTRAWIGIAVIVSVLGVYGDLVESLFKRGLGIKDSGNLLPGHGGVLDRIDAWFFVIPAVWVLLNFL